MIVEQAEIGSIKPYPHNPRKNDRAVEHVVRSIEQYGFQQPIVVDANREIVVGHTRYKAAQKLKFTHVPVVVAAELTEEQVRAYRLADNKTNEYALWDEAELAKEFEDLLKDIDLTTTASMTAFSEREIDRLLNGKNYNENAAETAKNQQTGLKQHRVAVVFPKHAYINRGVGTYVSGWIEWGLRNNVQVDLISNSGDVRNEQFDRYEQVAPWLAADDSPNTDDIIAMREPIFRLQDATGMRDSLYQALISRSYDAVILNTPDSLLAAVSLNLHEHLDNVYYVSHAPQDISIKPEFTYQLTQDIIRRLEIKLITQSTRMKQRLIDLGYSENTIHIVNPPLAQPELLDFNQTQTERKGILFIGPYEDNKDPELYISVCKETGFPALLITPSRQSADKFKQRFLEENIEHEIHVALTGQTKTAVIKRAALAVITSKEETFCYTAIEAATACPTLLPEERAWTSTHKNWCHVIPSTKFAEQARLLYGQSITAEQQQALLDYQREGDQQGMKLLAVTKEAKSINNALTKLLDKQGTTTQAEYSATRPSAVQSRPSKAIDELYYTFKLFSHPDYEITHDFDNTYIRYLKYIEPAHATTQEESDNLLATLLNIKE